VKTGRRSFLQQVEAVKAAVAHQTAGQEERPGHGSAGSVSSSARILRGERQLRSDYTNHVVQNPLFYQE
jgi:hypothetical protein